MADFPVQHLAVLINTTNAGTTRSTDGLNADYPVGYDNAWTDNPETDPSTNNLANRNMLVVGSTLVPRVLRTGGSGRPQFRDATETTCTCREYRIEWEDTNFFTLCTDMLPLNFASILVDAGLSFTANPEVWESGPTLPTMEDINALALLDTGWVAASAVCTETNDSPCP